MASLFFVFTLPLLCHSVAKNPDSELRNTSTRMLSEMGDCGTNVPPFEKGLDRLTWPAPGNKDGSWFIVYNKASSSKSRPLLLIWNSKVGDRLLRELNSKGHDWMTAFPAENAGAEFIEWIRVPENAAKYNVDPNRIATMGYSKGGFAAANVGKKLGRDGGVQGVILLNSGTREVRSSAKPYPSWLIITGLEDEGYVDGNARLHKDLQDVGAHVEKLDLPGVDHNGWRAERKLVFNTMEDFLIRRVGCSSMCAAQCETRFADCCKARRDNDLMSATEAYSTCSSRVRNGGPYWTQTAECVPTCAFTAKMIAQKTVLSACSAKCESKFGYCCKARRDNDGKSATEAYSTCSSRLRNGNPYWTQTAECVPTCAFTAKMIAEETLSLQETSSETSDIQEDVMVGETGSTFENLIEDETNHTDEYKEAFGEDSSPPDRRLDVESLVLV